MNHPPPGRWWFGGGKGRERMAQQADTQKEALPAVRALMVASSFAPLFLLWFIRGLLLRVDWRLNLAFGALTVVPTFLFVRVWAYKRNRRQYQTKRVIAPKEGHDQVIIYLFVLLLPFYSVDLTKDAEVVAAALALAVVGTLFLVLRLHYINMYLAVKGYYVYLVSTGDGEEPIPTGPPFVVLSRRRRLAHDSTMALLRLSNTVYIDEEEQP